MPAVYWYDRLKELRDRLTMTENIRAFLAIELPDHVRAALEELVEALHLADVRGLRPVKADGIHLTLKFLGKISREQVDPIVAATSRLVETRPPFTLELGRPGVFPHRRSPRVLWVGVVGELEPLLALQHEIEEALVSIGFARENRGFSPHLTLGRFRDRTAIADRLSAADALFSAPIEPCLGMDVNSVSLIRSTLLPDGAVYDPLARMALGGGSPT